MLVSEQEWPITKGRRGWARPTFNDSLCKKWFGEFLICLYFEWHKNILVDF
jgi:hypothetical protein